MDRMTDLAKLAAGLTEAKACADCLNGLDGLCYRGIKPFKQSYERRYTDSDFCGPRARFFHPKSPSHLLDQEKP